MNNKETEKTAFPTPKDRRTPGKIFPLNQASRPRNAALFCLTAALLLSGCSLALEEAPTKPGQDRLAGVFVTSEYIRQGTPEIKVNSQGEITLEETTEKIYGTLNKDAKGTQSPITFPGLEGYGLYRLEFPEMDFAGTGVTDYSSSISNIVSYYTSDDFFTDLHFSSTDEEEGAEGSLYVSTDTAFNYFFNPVYQQEDGQVYLLPGTGISTVSFVDGQQYGHDTAQSITRNTDGKEESKSYRFKVSIVAADPPVETELFFLSEGHQLLQSLTEAQLDAFGEGESPGLELPADVSYLILRQKTKNGTESTHRLFDRGEETLTYMVPAENQMLREIQLPLFWQDAGQ